MTKRPKAIKTWVFTLIIVSLFTVGCGSGSGDGASSTEFQVVAISPKTGETDVYRDKDILVTFNRTLDIDQFNDVIMVKGPNGETIDGKMIISQKSLIFQPARYLSNSVINVTVSAAVQSGDVTLAEDYLASFTTGEMLVGNKIVPPDGYNPLGNNGSDQVLINKIPEVAVVWNLNELKRIAIFDPAYNPEPLPNPAPLNTPAFVQDNTALAVQKIPIAGQFDDDKWDETAVFSYDYDGTNSGIIGLSIFDTTGNKQIVEVPTGLTFGSTDTYANGSFESVDLAVADFDNDGRDEIIIATAKRDRKNIYYYIVDYTLDGGYEIIKSGEIPADTLALSSVKIAVGDVDGDGKVETVFTWTTDDQKIIREWNGYDIGGGHSYYAILDDVDTVDLLLLSRENTYSSIIMNVAPQDIFDVAVGDIDGDGVDEIIFSTTYSNMITSDTDLYVGGYLELAQGIHLESGEFDLEIGNQIQQADGPHIIFNSGEKAYLSVLELADIDADGRKEILFNRAVFKIKENRDSESTNVLELEWRHDIPTTLIPVRDYITKATAWGPTVDVGMGDMDGDVKEDFVFLRRSNGGTLDGLGIVYPAGTWIEHFDLADCSPDSDDAGEDYCSGFDPNNPEIRMAWHRVDLESVNRTYSVRLALPNVDDDTIVLEKAGHTVYWGENSIVAILAAPPCSEDLGQDMGDCATEFGQGTTNSWDKGSYLGTSAGILLGFEFSPKYTIPLTGVQVELFSVESEQSFGAEFSWEHNWGYEATNLVTYSAGADNNLVIFDGYLYDRWQYKIVSHPEVDLIGTYMYISVPTAKKRYAVGQEYYNATNEIDIDENIMAVVPGDLSTYPNRSEADAIADSSLVAISNESKTVVSGTSNSMTLESSVSETQSNSYTVGGYTELSAKGCSPSIAGALKLCVGLEGSLSGGYATSNTWGHDQIFAGTVTGLPTDSWDAEKYEFGVFAYTKEIPAVGDSAGQKFLIVNYHVD